MATKRGVSLPQEAHDTAARRAEHDHVSTSAWIAAAIHEKALRESAAAAARFLTEPGVAEQLAEIQRWSEPAQAEQRQRWAGAA